MPRLSLSLALLTLFASAPVALHADSYDYFITTQAANGDPAYNFTVSGTFTGPADPFTASAFDVTSLTGNAVGYTFTGIVDPGTSNSQHSTTDLGFTFDNVLYTATGSPHTDANGFLIYMSSPVGTSLAHVFYTGVTSSDPGGYEVDVLDPNDPGAVTPFSVASQLPVTTFTIRRAFASPAPSSVPEPSTLALFGTGLAGLAGLIYRRRS